MEKQLSFVQHRYPYGYIHLQVHLQKDVIYQLLGIHIFSAELEIELSSTRGLQTS